MKVIAGLERDAERIAERIGMPVDSWPGKCYMVAMKVLDEGIVAGELETGYYHCADGDGLSDHGWIRLLDGRIFDPTRWTLEDTQPVVFVGRATSHYDVDGVRWEAELGKLAASLFPSPERWAEGLVV